MKHEAVVNLLLAKEGVDPDSKDKDSWTPLLCAAANTVRVSPRTHIKERSGGLSEMLLDAKATQYI